MVSVSFWDDLFLRFFFFLEGKGKSQMAALIASPKNTSRRMSCILMEKLKNTSKVSLC